LCADFVSAPIGNIVSTGGTQAIGDPEAGPREFVGRIVDLRINHACTLLGDRVRAGNMSRIVCAALGDCSGDISRRKGRLHDAALTRRGLPCQADSAAVANAWQALPAMLGFLIFNSSRGLSRASSRWLDRVMSPAGDDEKGSAMAEKPTASVSPDTADATSSEAPAAEREELASKLVDRFAVWSGVAGLVPLPIVDVVAVGGLQLQMLRRISQIYGIDFSENRGKALIASLAGSMIPATSGMGAASAMKFVPVLGTLTSVFVMPVLSAGATYAIGKAFIQHFESGGTLLDFNPPDYREFVKSQKEMWDRSTGSRSKASTGATASGS